MTAAAFTAWAVEALIASTLLMALVMVARAPVRRLFGPQVAYTLWALPALRLLLPPLPADWREQAAMPISRAGDLVTVLVLPDSAPAAAGHMVARSTTAATTVATTMPSLPWAAIVAGAWVLGAAAFFVHHLVNHRWFCRRLLSDARLIDQVGGVRVVESGHAAGPLAFGIARRFVAFPRDFADRYDADERSLALAHELGHHARGDLYANWAALAVLALHWFNPLAWRAFRAFRADQELANDARVLAGRSRADRHIYACAIVKAAHGGAVSAACHLHTITDLKGRLKMLTIARLSRTRLATGGAAVLALVTTGLLATASGTQAAAAISARMGDAVGMDLRTPPAPPAPAAPAIPAAGTKSVRRVVVVQNGRTTTYEGTAATAYLAAHPAPVPPTPPAPPATRAAPMAPVPPAPPAPPLSDMKDLVNIRSATCGPDANRKSFVINRTEGRQRVTVICTDRIQAAAQAGALTQADQQDIQRKSLTAALAGLEASKASLAANAGLGEEGRRDAIAEIEDAMQELRENIAEIDRD